MATSAMIIGHRGASGYRPEHTAAAYELAFRLGADAVEPDVVASRDGVLVVRHENEISGTTDVATRAEFAARRRTTVVAGEEITGWFTEDFTWAELASLRTRERLPHLRPASAAFDGRYPMLRLADLLGLVDAQSELYGHPLTLVAELKHASHFAEIGLPLDELFAAEVAAWAGSGSLIIESFEPTVLDQLRRRGLPGRYVLLIEATGAPADLVPRDGAAARSYADHLTDAGLAALAGEVHGVSVDKAMLLAADAAGRTVADSNLVERAHAAGLTVFTWTLRPENAFLSPGLRTGSDPGAFGRWLDEFRLVLGTGVDGVFADHPDLARASLRA